MTGAALKVCSGTAKGIVLKTVPGREVRPTSAKVRQAIFSALSDRIAGSRVLDLYAGTGAMGIEALSRGAAEAVFVEVSPKCLRAIKENLERSRLSDRATVLGGDVLRVLRRFGRERQKFDVVIADPPYCKAKNDVGRQRSLAEKTLKVLMESDILRPNSVVILEHSEMEGDWEAPAGLKALPVRKYGGTSVSIFTPT
jgi:16S rRNA (guanine(966)-N(2))-methyltransferase RsmD